MKGNNRQTFLSDNLNTILENTLVGVIGLGGGGSQIVQQLAHIGFKRYVLCDYDLIEATNLNRLVGSIRDDVINEASKISIASRLIRGIDPDAEIIEVNSKFQLAPEIIGKSDIIFGCLDGLSNREQLERFTRSIKIPYIDIGMDVIHPEGHIPRMAGQIITSLPGKPCMKCYGFINPKDLAKEEAVYGDAGIRPQVIWPNGILASTAIHVALNLLTNWTGRADKQVLYYEYDGNKGLVRPHVYYEMHMGKICEHYN
jgi:molybdopterin/thiamine biosynthesis adenylyltransferase